MRRCHDCLHCAPTAFFFFCDAFFHNFYCIYLSPLPLTWESTLPGVIRSFGFPMLNRTIPYLYYYLS